MARLFLTNIDLNTNELQNAVIQNLSSAPSSGNKEGRIYYDSVTHVMRVYRNGANGLGWYDVATGGTAASSIQINGAVSGNASVDPETGLITVTVSQQPVSVDLTTDTTGDYVADIYGTSNQISVTGSGGNNSTPTIALSDNVAITQSLSVAGGNFTVDNSGNVAASTSLNIASGAFTVNNAGNIVGNNINLAGTATIAGLTTLNGGLLVSGNTNLNGNATIGVDGTNTLTINSELQVNNAATFASDVEINTLLVDNIAFIGSENNGVSVDSVNGSLLLSGSSGVEISTSTGPITLEPASGQYTHVTSNLDVDGAVVTSTVSSNGALTLQSTAGTELTISGNTVTVDGATTFANDATFSGSVNIDGNLNVQGTLTAINKTEIDISDNTLVLNSNVTTGTPTQDAAIQVLRGSANTVGIVWSEGNQDWTLTNDGNHYFAVARKFVAIIGDGSNTSFDITHNFGTRDLQVQVYKNSSSYDVVETDIMMTDANNITIGFASAPSTNAYKVVIVG